MSEFRLNNPHLWRTIPPALAKAIHEYTSPIQVGCEQFAEWQLVASYRGSQEAIDYRMENEVRRGLAHAATEKITVYQDQSCKQGRRYYASMIAMSEVEFLNFCYFIYEAGISEGRRSIPPAVVA